ncbi:MAG: MotA/TolQ/ExbB proton channel family protein [Sandaracinaceae bacterium]
MFLQLACSVLGLILQVALTVMLARWASRVARDRGGLFRHARWLPWVGLLASLVGVLLTVLGLASAFDAVSQVGPEARAHELAEGISAAMVSTAAGAAFAVLSYLGSAALSAYGTWGPSSDGVG